MLKNSLPTTRRKEIHIGDVFERWTVKDVAAKRFDGSRYRSYWLCECSCKDKTLKEIGALRLTGGKSLSCGCFTKERTVETNTSHGKSRSATYSVYRDMKQRVLNPNKRNFKDYGGRGVGLHPLFMTFEGFLSVVGERPSEAYSIDRYPDNNGDYAPGNVRWATRGEQARNTRATRYITWRGETLCIVDWGKKLGIPHQTVTSRLRLGWPLDDVFGRPVRANRNRGKPGTKRKLQ